MTDSMQSENLLKVCDVITCLHTGGVVMLPTDTVFGLAVLPTQTLGVDRLYALKARHQTKALPVMVANAGQLVDLGVIISLAVEKLLNSPFMPGALTIVAAIDPKKCPDWLCGRDEVAFRIPNSVTSANLAGAPTQQTVCDILAQLTGAPDLVVQGEAGADIASTLVNCSKNPAVIERVGAVSMADLSKWVAVRHG